MDWAVRGGVRRRLALRLLRIGRVLEARPQVEEDLRAGRLDGESAAEIGKVLSGSGAGRAGGPRDVASGEMRGGSSDPALLLPDEVMPADSTGDDARTGVDLEAWIDRAKTVSERQLRREVREHVERRAQGEPVVPMGFAVAESTRDAFRRARAIASRRARTALTDGETLAVVTRDYLGRHDPLLRQRRPRRVGPTSERPQDRYIPAEVRAAVLARSGDCCEFAGCGFGTFLQFAHVIGHEDDGDREAANLLRLCTTHHTLLDAGRIRFLGFAATGGGGDEADVSGAAGATQRAEFLIVSSGEIVTAAHRTQPLPTTNPVPSCEPVLPSESPPPARRVASGPESLASSSLAPAPPASCAGEGLGRGACGEGLAARGLSGEGLVRRGACPARHKTRLGPAAKAP